MNGASLALFLDRDGIINIDKGYVYKWEDIIWIEETIELIKCANQLGYKVIVITNQSGVEKGKYLEDDVVCLHQKMDEYLSSRNAFVTDWFYCIESTGNRRKPNPGMIKEAASKYSIDLSRSVMIGDKVSDIIQLENVDKHFQTFIVRGAYNLSSIETHCPERVKILNNHQEMLKEVSRCLQSLSLAVV